MKPVTWLERFMKRCCFTSVSLGGLCLEPRFDGQVFKQITDQHLSKPVPIFHRDLDGERKKFKNQLHSNKKHVRELNATTSPRSEAEVLENEQKMLKDLNESLAKEVLRLTAANDELQRMEESLKEEKQQAFYELKIARQELCDWNVELIEQTSLASKNFLGTSSQVCEESSKSLREQTNCLFVLVDKMQAKIDELKTTAQQFKKENSDLKSELTDSETLIEQLTEKRNKYKKRIKNCQQQLGSRNEEEVFARLAVDISISLTEKEPTLDIDLEKKHLLDTVCKLEADQKALEDQMTSFSAKVVELKIANAELEGQNAENTERVNELKLTLESVQLENRETQLSITDRDHIIKDKDVKIDALNATIQELCSDKDDLLETLHKLKIDQCDLKAEDTSLRTEVITLKAVYGQLQHELDQEMRKVEEINLTVEDLEFEIEEAQRCISDKDLIIKNQDDKIVTLTDTIQGLRFELDNSKKDQRNSSSSDTGSQTEPPQWPASYSQQNTEESKPLCTKDADKADAASQSTFWNIAAKAAACCGVLAVTAGVGYVVGARH